MSSSTRFRTLSMKDLMSKAEGGKDTVYPVYEFSGRKEYYKDRVGGIKPRFAGRK